MSTMSDLEELEPLKDLFKRVLLAFKEASDHCEDLLAAEPGEPSYHLKSTELWLRNATASLISWSLDIRLEADSLSALEKSPLEDEIRAALYELRHLLESIFEKCMTQSAPLQSLATQSNETVGDDDPIQIMSSLIGILQDTVRPIRMKHATVKREGPYGDLKRQIDDIYNDHVRCSESGQPPLCETESETVALLTEEQTKEATQRLDLQIEEQEWSRNPKENQPGLVETVNNYEQHLKDENVRQKKAWEEYEAQTNAREQREKDKMENEDFWANIGNLIRSQCQVNWHGAHFLLPNTLQQILSHHAVTRLCSFLEVNKEETSLSDFSEFVDRIVNAYTKILGICLYARLGPSIFYMLANSKFSDADLPLKDIPQQLLPLGIGGSFQSAMQRFVDSQWVFLPVQLFSDEVYVQLETSAVLPLQFDTENDLIGHGEFSSTYKVHIPLDIQIQATKAWDEHKRFVLKHFHGLPGVSTATIDSKRLAKEMNMLDHPHLLQQIRTYSYGDAFYLLFPAPNCTLRDLLDSETFLTSPSDMVKALQQFHQIINATKLLHDHNSSQAVKSRFVNDYRNSIRGAHLDLKPQNILIFQDESIPGTWKIGDFGIAVDLDLQYASPDLIFEEEAFVSNNINLGQQYDVWSLGCIFLELILWLYGPDFKPLREDLRKVGEIWCKSAATGGLQLKPNIVTIFDKVRHSQFGKFLLHETIDLVESMLQVDWRKRPQVSEVDRRLVHILTQEPDSFSLLHSENAIQSASETESVYESDVPSDWSNEDDQSGTYSPDTEDSDFEYPVPETRATWHRRRLYPLLLNGLEPSTLQDDIIATITRYARAVKANDSSEKSTKPNAETLKHMILRSLSFTGMGARETQIGIPLEGTCDWIFDESCFEQWLSSSGLDDNTLWIPGKAGSGKSTIIKYVLRNVEQRIKTKSSTKAVYGILSHFFWFAGSLQESSYAGFLGSLLYQLFRQCDELIPQLFPDLWNVASQYSADFINSLPDAWHDWSLEQLRRLLESLLHLLVGEKRFYLMIDGLDECREGDISSVIATMRQLSSSGNFKIICSSRPQNIFVDLLQDCPRLSLHEHTGRDIELLVRHSLPKIMDASISEAIVEKIKANADGVFLWVLLIVQELKLRFYDGLSTTDLKRLLSALPVDLDLIYTRMIGQIAKSRKIESSMIFQILLESSKPLTLGELGFAIVNYDMTASQVYEDLTKTSALDLLLRRVVHSCGGLVEIRSSDSSEYTVSFIHESVREFLLRQHSREPQRQPAVRRGFDVNVALLRASVFHIFTMMTEALEWEEWKLGITTVMEHALKAERSTGQAQTTLLDSLDDLVGRNDLCLLLQGDLQVTETATHWSSAVLHNPEQTCCDCCPESFLSFAVMYGLTLYSTAKIRHLEKKAEVMKKPLLFYATTAALIHGIPLSLPTIKALFDLGANPNRRFDMNPRRRTTPWQLLLEYAYYENDKRDEDLCDVCELFLRHEADNTISVHTGRYFGEEQDSFSGTFRSPHDNSKRELVVQGPSKAVSVEQILISVGMSKNRILALRESPNV